MQILLLDDHAMFRDGLHYMLKVLDPEVELLQAGSMEAAQALIEQHPHLALLLIDLDMPVHNGFEALDVFTTLYPTIPCAILSASTNRSDVTTALQAGALGFISKSTQGTSLHNAIKLMLSGEVYVPYEIMYSERRTSRNDTVQLTERQLQVMALVTNGYPNKIISDKLDLAEATVKMHLSAIFAKLKVHNRSAAIVEVQKQRISLPKLD